MTFKQLYILVFFMAAFSNDSYELKYFKYVINDDLVEVEETKFDELFIKHTDSLNAYFGNLEITLLQRHKENHDNIQTPEDFQAFYRNAITLRATMHQKLKRRADYFIKEKGVKELPDASWFNEVAVGMKVRLSEDKLNYGVVFDYNDFVEQTHKTEGKTDDEYLKLMMKGFDPYTNFPTWLQMTKDGSVCSVLGSGKHMELLQQISSALEEGDLFYKEIYKVKSQVFNDILFSKSYLKSHQKVVAEVEKINSQVSLEEKDSVLILTRMKNLKKPDLIKETTFGIESNRPLAKVF